MATSRNATKAASQPKSRSAALSLPWFWPVDAALRLTERNLDFLSEAVKITRPPQSWGYVRELEEVHNEQEGE